VVGAVDSGQVATETGEAKQFWRPAEVAVVFRRRLLLWFSWFCLNRLVLWLNVVDLDVVGEVLLVLEHSSARLAAKDLAVLVPLFVTLAEFDRVKHDVTIRTSEIARCKITFVLLLKRPACWRIYKSK
jgi:hypothetical protein